jgi:WD40 repeat protein
MKLVPNRLGRAFFVVTPLLLLLMVDLLGVANSELRKTLTTESASAASYFLDVAFSPDGTRVAAVDWNGSVTVWDAATGERIATRAKHDGGVISLAFSPDGKTLATGSEDLTLRLWKLDDVSTK